MKDSYSFDRNEEEAKESYRRMQGAYHRIFTRCGLRFKAVDAESGLIGGTYSQEFMVLADTGEDTLVTCPDCDYAASQEKQKGQNCPNCNTELLTCRGIEVGHIFMLGDKYSKSMKANYLDKDGREVSAVMGCYGIGIGRTAAAAIEQNHDAKGIIWPPSLSPFQVHIIPVQDRSEKVMKTVEFLYDTITQDGVEVLLDDRSERPGVKFNDADLVGIPVQITVGEKNLKEGFLEAKERRTGVIQKIPVNEAIQHIKKLLDVL